MLAGTLGVIRALAAPLQKGKATLIDIRPENEFKRNHAEGAVNVPLFIPVQRMTPGLLLKRIGYAFLAMTPRGEMRPGTLGWEVRGGQGAQPGTSGPQSATRTSWRRWSGRWAARTSPA